MPVSYTSRLQHLQSVIPESQLPAIACLSRQAPALLLAVLNFFWHQHKTVLGSQFSVVACEPGQRFLSDHWPLTTKTCPARRRPAADRVVSLSESRRDKSSTSRRSRHRSFWLRRSRNQCRREIG